MLPLGNQHDIWTVYDEITYVCLHLQKQITVTLILHKIDRIRGPTELQDTVYRN
jgi:hypothetical protein